MCGDEMKKYDIELRSCRLDEPVCIYDQPSFLLDEEIEAANSEEALDIYLDWIKENIYGFVDEPDNLIINCDGSEIEVINKEKNIKEIYIAKQKK